MPAEVIARFQEYTGLTYGVDADFVDAAATLGGQTGLSIFVSVTAFILVLLLEPPIRLFTAWRPVVSDRRPTYLALGLLAAFVVVLVIPATSSYFGLTGPARPVVLVVVPAVVVWFLVLSAALRWRLLDRALGLTGNDLSGGRVPLPPATATRE